MTSPPAQLVSQIDRLAPGFWSAWSRAVSTAYGRAPFQVTSWWRSRAYNAEVGGAEASQHLLGVAFDVVPATRAVQSALAAVGFITVNEGDHIHAQPWPAGSASGLLRYLGI